MSGGNPNKCGFCYGRFDEKKMRWAPGKWICPDCWAQAGKPEFETYEQIYGKRTPLTDAQFRRNQEVDDNLAFRRTELHRHSGRTTKQQAEWERDGNEGCR